MMSNCKSTNLTLSYYVSSISFCENVLLFIGYFNSIIISFLRADSLMNAKNDYDENDDGGNGDNGDDDPDDHDDET